MAYSTRAFTADGPNTVGEAGKVYFAWQVEQGQWPIADGLSAPYYPSVHGLLTHAVVGLWGRSVGARETDLYSMGRWISLLLTVAALFLLGDVGRRLGARPAVLAWCLLLWVGTPAFLQHAVSYRPDNWLLFLESIALWTVLFGRNRSHVWNTVLLLLPMVAFHVKAPGVAIGAEIVLGLGLIRGWKPAVLLGAGQGVLLAASLAIVQWASGGRYLSAFAHGVAGVGGSPGQVLLALLGSRDVVLPFLVITPATLLGRIRHLGKEDVRTRALVAFWAASTSIAVVISTRAGSDSYYFLGAGTYGLLCWAVVMSRWKAGQGADTLVAKTGDARLHLGVSGAAVTLLALFGPLAVPGHERGSDIALAQTERVAGDRQLIADRINRGGQYCYTDDPGLNVLLKRPAVIYPSIEVLMMRSRALPVDLLEQRLREGSFDCMVSTGMTLTYPGSPMLQADFWRTAQIYYPRIERQGIYRVMFPRRPGRASGMSLVVP